MAGLASLDGRQVKPEAMEKAGHFVPPFPALCECGHGYLQHCHFSAEMWCWECGTVKGTGKLHKSDVRRYVCPIWNPSWLLAQQLQVDMGEVSDNAPLPRASQAIKTTWEGVEW